MVTPFPEFFSWLTPDKLAAWAGEAVYKRGLAYQKAGRVSNPVLTSDENLLATVFGSQRYTTLLFKGNDGKLTSVCTCPYDARCKHAVALACEGLALQDSKKQIPYAEANDRRLLDVETEATSGDGNSTDCLSPQELEAILQKHSKDQLIALVLRAVQLAPDVAMLCVDTTKPSPKGRQALVKEARKALRKALETPNWEGSWTSPQYDTVRNKIEVLRLSGFPEEVLELGLELIQDSEEQISTYDDNGEIHYDIAQCMDSVFQALRDVDWPVYKKIQWAVDAILLDEFSVSECFWEILREKHPSETWNPVADILLHRLDQHKEKSFSRRALVDMTLYALTAAERADELLDLHKREALQFDEYEPLVQYLLATGHDDRETEEWIRKGIANTEKKEPHTARRLSACLLELRVRQKDWDDVLCLQVEEFVWHPSLNQFHECRDSAKKVTQWDSLRPLLMLFLTDRKLPWTQSAWPCRNTGKPPSSREEKLPAFDTLIDLAIHEKKPAEVLKWYDLQCKAEREYGDTADKVATAVQHFAPEKAIALWEKLADGHIARVKPKAYVDAAVYMRKMEKIMSERQMTAQWTAYIQSLRTKYRNRPRLMEVLDKLSFSRA